MTKFEEEVKRPSSELVAIADNANQALYKKFCELEEDVKNLSEQVIEKNEHILKVENENSFLRDKHTTFDSNGMAVEPKLQQQALPVVPECVDEFIRGYDDIQEISMLYVMKDFADSKYFDDFCAIQDDLEKYGRWDDMLYKAIRFGYTVEKTKLFYLREKNTGYYLNKPKNNGLELVPNPYLDEDNQFTQQEIDSLNTGSYEQIEVTE